MDKLDITEINIKEILKQPLRCQGCGKFISQKSIEEGKSKFHFIPDSVCGPEESYWECEKCS